MASYQRYRKRKHRHKKCDPPSVGPGQEAYNFHHFLFQARHWDQGYAKMLRSHPYAGARIPMRTLHREIHSKVHDVPRPNGDICKRTYEKLVRLCKSGKLDPRNDSPEKKLQFFIDEWAEICPATVEILRWQQQIIRKYYRGKGVRMMSQEIRWDFEANVLYEFQPDRDEVYDILTSNGVSPASISGDGERLAVVIPNANMTLFLRYTEIITRFPVKEQSIHLQKVG